MERNRASLHICLFAIFYWSSINSLSFASQIHEGILYPRESESREVKTLDGLWNFRLSEADMMVGFRNKWFSDRLSKTGPTIPMPVPSSYNDITTDKKIRDYVGIVWYDRTFYVPDRWRQAGYHVWLRFGSVHYATEVWINGHSAIKHEIGHLPFKCEITSFVEFGKKNLITVAVDNTLLQTTLPQGTLMDVTLPDRIEVVQTYTFDFFNYAGIHRSVHLYTTPAVYIDDITVHTDVKPDGTGIVRYNITIAGSLPTNGSIDCSADLLDHDRNVVGCEHRETNSNSVSGAIEIPNATLWWPYLMHPSPGYLYTLEIRLSHLDWGDEDVYRQPVGIRKLEWNNTGAYINKRPIYMRGFGRHEDSDLRGKGFDLPLVARDYNLIKWIGANAYRTSHYPYAEEIMDFADQIGIMIIDECPAVDVENYSSVLLQRHTDSLTELIRRDKNRPSVIMWSVANEPRSHFKEAEDYFRTVTSHTRQLDPTRPLTAAIAVSYANDCLGQFLDIIGFNRYNAWYSNTGRLEVIQSRLEDEALKWNAKYDKPVFMSEFGADTIAGFHTYPSSVWTEEFQVELLSEHFKAFDNLRKKRFFIGEMIWNFADFGTAQDVKRAVGNKKGLFSRQRQPKASAHHVRKRYWLLAKNLDGAQLPSDFDDYLISGDASSTNSTSKTEL